ncbi:MAG: translocation/assembly module TamB domain-containing protein [Bdellovibrionales bacterium]|nr:translocation/assembly module TamB domain-containing protein [Bdellovibrionales bacterium]
MIRRPLLIFLSVVLALTMGVLFFLQSKTFAGMVKRFAQDYIPKDLGVEADFSEFAVRVFPPGLSLKNPKVVVTQPKLVDLPAGTQVQSERLDLIFLPFQMLSGDIRVNEVVVVNGKIQLHFDQAYMKARAEKKSRSLRGEPTSFRWDELFRVRAESISLENTEVELKVDDPGLEVKVLAKELGLSQWKGRGGLGYELKLDLNEFSGRFPKEWRIPGVLESVQARLQINPAGIQVENFKFRHRGVEAEIKGKATGSVISAKSLISDLRLKSKVEVADLVEFLNLTALKNQATGSIAAELDLKGDLLNPGQSLKVKGRVRGTALKLVGYDVEKLESDLEWIAEQDGPGRLKIEKASFESPLRERSGTKAPGSGGKFQILETELNLGSHTPMRIPLLFEGAHFHWLLGPAAKETQHLIFKVHGKVDADLTIPKDPSQWSLAANMSIGTRDFILDNQHHGKPQPLRKLLDLKEIKLDGKAVVNGKAVQIGPLTIAVADKTRFHVESGVIDYTKGFNVPINGPVDLSEIGILADRKIFGTGNLKTMLAGGIDSFKLIFDADLKDTEYLDLHLGDVKGQIWYDDKSQILGFDRMQVATGRTKITGGGKIYLKEKDGKMDMRFPIQEGSTQDLFSIFSDMTQSLKWLPRSMTGDLTGSVRIGGTLDLDGMEIEADVDGQNWDYLGERFKSVRFQGGYTRGAYWINGFDAVKKQGHVRGKIRYEDKDRKISWNLESQGLGLAEFDLIGGLDLPLRGSIEVSSSGKGNLTDENYSGGKIESQSHFELNDLRVRGAPMPASRLTLLYKNDSVEMKGDALGGQGTVDLAYSLKKGGSSRLDLKFAAFDFSPVLLLLNPTLVAGKEVVGRASGRFKIQFPSGEVERGTGQMSIEDYVISKQGYRLQLGDPVHSNIEKGVFNLEGIKLRSGDSIATGTFSGTGDRVSGSIQGGFSLGFLEFLTPVISRAEGALDLDMKLAGKLKEPVFSGRIGFNDNSVLIRSVESPFENLTGSLSVRQNVVTVQNLEAAHASGRVDLTGTLTLFSDRVPEMNLSCQLTDPKIKAYPFQFVKLRGKLTATGKELPYKVKGEMLVSQALSTEKVLSAGKRQRASGTARFLPQGNTLRARDSDDGYFNLDIRVLAEKGMLVRNDLFDLEAKADIRLVNTIDNPGILGSAEAIQGKVNFSERSFQIQSATMEFDSAASINPKINLVASTEIKNVKIQMSASGRLNPQPRIDFTSNPTMSEQDLIQLLATGASASQRTQVSQTDRGLVDTTAAASLVLSTLDFNREFQQKTGFQIQIDDAINTAIGNSIFRATSETTNSVAPKIVIKKRIANKVEVSAGSTVGVGTTIQREVNAEYEMTKGLSVLGVWRSVEDVDPNKSIGSSFGFDLKAQKRFK